MNTLPLISVVIPCYNQEAWLAQTLDCVLAQTYANWECVVVDDGSTDGSAAIVKDYMEKDARVRYFKRENGGLSAARNSGVRQSSGKYILPLDGDDLIEPNYLEEAVNYLEAHPETKLVYCQAQLFGTMNGPWKLPPYEYRHFILDNCIFCACVYRKADYEKTGGYDENMKSGMEDWEFLLRLLSPEDAVYQIPQVLFHYRTRKHSLTARMRKREKDVLWQVFCKHPEIYKDLLWEAVLEQPEANKKKIYQYRRAFRKGRK
ncbi:MAG: glycosyltransferase [Bacteroidales bacterium]|nr:glycosyltransferase [Bacteroidales bacterium]